MVDPIERVLIGTDDCDELQPKVTFEKIVYSHSRQSLESQPQVEGVPLEIHRRLNSEPRHLSNLDS